jgi:hypothetical protein
MLWAWRFCRAGASWVIAATLFGLLPLWFRLGRAALFPGAEVDWEVVLKDGLLLYFSMAIISAVTADYYLVERRRYSKYHLFYMMFLFPVILYVSCVYMIFLIPQGSMDTKTLNKFFDTEMTIIVCACLFALVHKGRHIVGIEDESQEEGPAP